MRRLDRQLAHRRDSQTQKTRSHRDRRGRATDRWRTQELMAQRHVLEGDGRRPEEHGAEERPETDHETSSGHPGIRHGV